MSSKEILRRALPHWPHDALRPTAQLGSVLQARLQQQPPSSSSPSIAVKPFTDQENNAILSLLTNKFAHKYAVPARREDSMSGGTMTPRSNPEYYKILMQDLEEVPSRTWLQRMGIKLKGFVRMS
ncbi:unnamed protein product [Discula destructiva]